MMGEKLAAVGPGEVIDVNDFLENGEDYPEAWLEVDPDTLW
jgi:hypothetical protein